MKLFKWSERDYKWLIFILILIIGIILTWRLNDNDSVVNIISMIASGASIALAVIAIMQSIAYNESANSTYNAITEKLINLEHNTDDIKQKLMVEVNTVIENSDIPEDEKNDLKANIEANIEKDIIHKKAWNKEYTNITFYKLIDRIIDVYKRESFIQNRSGLVLATSDKEQIDIPIILADYISISTISKKIENVKMLNNTIVILIYSTSMSNRIERFKTYSDNIRIISYTEIDNLSDEELRNKLNLPIKTK